MVARFTKLFYKHFERGDIMFNSKEKTFHCNNCGKLILTDELVWTKWRFPAKSGSSQLKARKELEFENAPIICETCSKKIIKMPFQ